MPGRIIQGVKLLLLDYDCTITVGDTTHLVFQATDIYQKAPPAEQQALRLMWEKLSVDYMNGYNAIVDSFLNTCLNGSVNTNIEELLKTLDLHNYSSAVNLAKQHIFDSIQIESIPALAESVALSKGSLELFQKACAVIGSKHCHIVSVNWLPELIRCSLRDSLPPENIHAGSVPVLDCSITCASTQLRRTERAVVTAHDKRSMVCRLRTEAIGCGAVVYIGDSLTDILALLEADVGIIVGNNRVLGKITACLGIVLKHLHDLLKAGSLVNLNSEEPHTLYIATSFDEIDSLLFG